MKYTAGDGGHATNLEAALRDGAASLPAGLVPRMRPHLRRQRESGQRRRARSGRRGNSASPSTRTRSPAVPSPNLRLESVGLPPQVFSGERFPIDIALDSPRRATATVEITAEGKSLGISRVELEPGVNHFRVHASVSAVGAVDLAGKISAAGLGEARFEQAVTLRRPHVLLITQDPPGTEKHLLQTLEANQFEVRTLAERRRPTSSRVPDRSSSTTGTWSRSRAAQRQRWRNSSSRAAGCCGSRGERNVYVENKDGRGSPGARACPPSWLRRARPRAPASC